MMKKKLLWILLTIFLVGSFSGMANAAMVGPPVSKGEAGKISLGTGISFWTKKLESDDLDGSENVDSTRLLLTPTYSIVKQCDVFLRLGLVDSEFEINDVDIDTDMAIAYGGGVKFTFFEEKKFRVGAVIQLLMWSADDEVTVAGNDLDVEIDSLELDIAIGTNVAIDDRLSFYGGFMLGKDDADLEISLSGYGSETFDAEEDSIIGLFGGLTYDITEMFGVGLEARLITETSITFMGNFSFN